MVLWVMSIVKWRIWGWTEFCFNLRPKLRIEIERERERSEAQMGGPLESFNFSEWKE